EDFCRRDSDTRYGSFSGNVATTDVLVQRTADDGLHVGTGGKTRGRYRQSSNSRHDRTSSKRVGGSNAASDMDVARRVESRGIPAQLASPGAGYGTDKPVELARPTDFARGRTLTNRHQGVSGE